MAENAVGFGQRIAVQTEAANFVGGAILEIVEGKKTDLAFHMQTHKVVYILQGQIRVWVLKDGQMNNLLVDAGQSFYVKPGLIHQLEAVKKAVVVEFVSDTTYAEKDTSIVVKGQSSVPPAATVLAPGEYTFATPEEVAPTEAPVEVEAPKKTTKKTTKKRTTRKKKSKKVV